MITKYAWGEIWSRPGLDRRTRSCITLAALVALGRDHELPLHVRAALRNGLTVDEIKEVLLHTAVYAGSRRRTRRSRSRSGCWRRKAPRERRTSRTQVGIVGAGPAGLTLAHLLHREGIDSVVIEDRSRDYVEARIRAGVLEQRTADLLAEAGVGGRMQREGIVHDGIELQFDGERHRIAFDELTGKSIVIYGQTEVVKDLIEARLESGRPLLFEVGDVSVSDLETDRPRLAFTHEGARQELECDVIAGCDGFHGVCRPSIPDGVLTEFSREYPFGWLGILAAVAPSIEELVYSAHQRGFALLSLRTPELSRYYLQCAPDEDLGAVAGREDLGGAPAAGRLEGGRSRRGRSSRRASPECAAMWSSRCSTAGCSWQAMRRTSSRRRARRG